MTRDKAEMCPGRPRAAHGTEIAPGVHAVPLRGALAHVIEGDDGLTLIDAGLPMSRGRLEAFLASRGWSLVDIVRVVCTHGHPDHAGGVRGFEHARLEVRMHAADIATVRSRLPALVRRPSRGGLFGYVTPTPARLEALEDGEVIPVPGGLVVVHTPGHTPGSVCLWLPARGLLFVGDALQMRRGRPDFANVLYSSDRRRAEVSVRRMAELDVEAVVFSHYPPWRLDARATLEGLAARARSAPGDPG